MCIVLMVYFTRFYSSFIECLFIWYNYAHDLNVIEFSCFLSIMCGNACVAGIARKRYIVYSPKDYKNK